MPSRAFFQKGRALSGSNEVGRTQASIIQWILRVTLLVYYVAVDAVQIFTGYDGSRTAGLFLTGILAAIIFLLLLNGSLNLSIRITILHFYLIAWIACCLVNSLMAINTTTALVRTMQLAKFSIAAVVYFISFDHNNAIDEMLHLVMYGGFILVSLYVAHYGFDYIASSLSSSERITSELINSNTLGMSAAYSCLIYLFYWISGTFEPLGVPFALLSLIIIIASQSRKAILILVLGVALYLLLARPRRLPSARLVLAFVGVALLVILLNNQFDLAGVTDRIVGLVNSLTGKGQIDKSTFMRNSFIDVGLGLFREHPAFGVGVDCSKYYTTFLYGYTYHLHNNYVELLSDMGIIGLVAYYWIYAYMLVQMLRGRIMRIPQGRLCLALLIIRLIMDYGFYAFKEQGTYLFLVLFFVCYEQGVKGMSANTLTSRPQGLQVATLRHSWISQTQLRRDA